MGWLRDTQPWKPVAASFASSSVAVGFGFRPASWSALCFSALSSTTPGEVEAAGHRFCQMPTAISLCLHTKSLHGICSSGQRICSAPLLRIHITKHLLVLTVLHGTCTVISKASASVLPAAPHSHVKASPSVNTSAQYVCYHLSVPQGKLRTCAGFATVLTRLRLWCQSLWTELCSCQVWLLHRLPVANSQTCGAAPVKY